MPMGRMYKYRSKKKKVNAIQVKQMINRSIETKYKPHDWLADDIGTSATGPIDERLFNIVQGNGATGRVGKRISVKSIEGKFHLVYGDSSNVIRVVLYRAKNTGDTLTSASIDVDSHIDRESFVVYSDRYYSLSSVGPGARSFVLNKRFKGLGKIVDYATSAGDSTTQNDYRLYMVSDSGAITHPRVTGQLTVYYKDG